MRMLKKNSTLFKFELKYGVRRFCDHKDFAPKLFDLVIPITKLLATIKFVQAPC